MSLLLKNKQKPDWSFQDDAVETVSKKFTNNIGLRSLLVIPTGGGKTKTALRTINKLIDKGVLGKEKKVLWVVHTKALRDQALDEFVDDFNKKNFGFDEKLRSVVDVCMVAEARRIIEEGNHANYSLIVIDEAHHSAANSYKSFFQSNLGILGLTATPSRTDEQELKFDDVAYSITFKELVKKGVIILPKFISKPTNIVVDVDSISISPKNINTFDKFNIPRRNEIVARNIFNLIEKENIKKVIVFVGTRKHTEDLYEKVKFLNERKKGIVDHVGYIHGDNRNEKNQDNKTYLKSHKNIKSSILINCRLLNEGYDDPSIDAVVMATPTSSILYYMQCVGRVVREPKKDGIASKAIVLELVDSLPNVIYRIDNRWLFAEISDYLEPEVVDKRFLNNFHFKLLVKNVLKSNGLDLEALKKSKSLDSADDFSLLLFNEEPDEEFSKWKVLPFTGDSKHDYIRAYNYLGDNIGTVSQLNHNFVVTQNSHAAVDPNDQFFSNHIFRTSFILSLERANDLKERKRRVDCLKYYTFSKSKPSFELLFDFLKLLVNK